MDALQSERRDRSILFWKSLPVSDFTTVMSKALIPIVVVPLFAFAVAVALQWIMLLLSSAVLLVSGQSVVTLWSKLSFFHMSLLLLSPDNRACAVARSRIRMAPVRVRMGASRGPTVGGRTARSYRRDRMDYFSHIVFRQPGRISVHWR